jgi:hypothetical protein
VPCASWISAPVARHTLLWHATADAFLHLLPYKAGQSQHDHLSHDDVPLIEMWNFILALERRGPGHSAAWITFCANGSREKAQGQA